MPGGLGQGFLKFKRPGTVQAVSLGTVQESPKSRSRYLAYACTQLAGVCVCVWLCTDVSLYVCARDLMQLLEQVNEYTYTYRYVICIYA